MVTLGGPISYDTALDKYRQATACICVGVSGTTVEFQVPAKLYEFISFGNRFLPWPGHLAMLQPYLRAGVEYFLADHRILLNIFALNRIAYEMEGRKAGVRREQGEKKGF